MKNVFELINSDWQRYYKLHKKLNILIKLVIFFHNPGMLFSIIYRFENYLFQSNNIISIVIRNLFYPFYFIFTYYILNIDIPPQVSIGKGLYVHNRGIIFSQSVKAGDNLTLIGPLTIGMKGTVTGGGLTPSLGNDVFVFSGARVIGGIKVGNNVYIGANAVVLKNVPSNCVVGGVPAKIIKRLKRNEIL